MNRIPREVIKKLIQSEEYKSTGDIMEGECIKKCVNGNNIQQKKSGDEPMSKIVERQQISEEERIAIGALTRNCRNTSELQEMLKSLFAGAV